MWIVSDRSEDGLHVKIELVVMINFIRDIIYVDIAPNLEEIGCIYKFKHDKSAVPALTIYSSLSC